MKDQSNRSRNPGRLYRDTENGLIAGVCAGVADYFGVPVNTVRIVTFIIGLVYSVPVLIFYFGAAWLLPAKPRNLYRDPDDERFWRAYRRSPLDTLGETKRKFRDLERKLRRMESYVTSRKFDLDREFKNMK